MFSDIESHWAKECIVQLGERSLVKGYSDGKFRPEAPLTRAEFASLMVGAFGKSPDVQKAVNFKDVPKNHWAWQFIQTVSKKRFFSGYPDGTFRPEQPILRVEAITVIASALNLPNPKSPEVTLKDAFDDAAEIPNYAKNVMAAATQRAIVVNYPNVRKLRPNQNATRGEVAALFCRALRIYTVPDKYIAVSIAGNIAPRPIFGRTPEIIESYFGFPISGSSYASTAIKRFCCTDFIENTYFSVEFENGKAVRISFDLGQFQQDKISIDPKKEFEYVFGYPPPTWRYLKGPDYIDGGYFLFEYCLGDGVRLFLMQYAQKTTVSTALSYDSTCEPPYN
ncbi:S-layer homology domain-containing protein [Kamptonema sp. UHCC 0994]|uniref:S-layer homology domain-containing protein n=1 Tax=Kamptonema sp. UHCC 0994 TaxID=3031329 RepID=UPI0023BAE31B|nr:S-layer homology domain-containing protein [Kamptonema sp. UHCC 0994]MDF0556328.1 S-layer homology domain-containing protein [Kamptonema sp. UHCC 0994]